MRYELNDTTAYGIYNGLSESDIRNMLGTEAEKIGLSIVDYSSDEITRTLNRDPELKAIAQAHYVPYPVDESWGSDYKANWRKMSEAGTAPGYGEVSDDIVRQKLSAILDDILENVVAPRKKKELEERERQQEILSHVVSVTTKERDIRDEGGLTKQYTHEVLMPSGETYVFVDRNVFDVGRVINYNGAMLIMEDGVIGWSRWVDGAGWDFEPANEEDEAVQAYCAAALYGFANSTIRM